MQSKQYAFKCYSLFAKANIVDKSNFKKPNVFGAFVNAMFNGGVFLNPPQEQC